MVGRHRRKIYELKQIEHRPIKLCKPLSFLREGERMGEAEGGGAKGRGLREGVATNLIIGIF